MAQKAATPSPTIDLSGGLVPASPTQSPIDLSGGLVASQQSGQPIQPIPESGPLYSVEPQEPSVANALSGVLKGLYGMTIGAVPGAYQMLQRAEPFGVSPSEMAQSMVTAPSEAASQVTEAPAQTLPGKLALQLPGVEGARAYADLAARLAGHAPLTGANLYQLQSQAAELPGQLLGTAAGMKAAPLLEQLGETPEEARVRAKNTLLKQRPIPGMDKQTIDAMDRLGEQGHLSNIEKFRPTTYREALDATRAYMGAYFMKTIGPALLRHGDAAMDLQPVADAVAKLHNPNIEQVLPEDIPAIDKDIARFKGKQIPIKDGYELLTRLNAATRNLESMTPADQAAAMNKSMALNSLSTAKDALRNQIYGTFDSLGEHGIEQAQKEYGDMMSWRQFLDKNIATSEKAQAKMPGLGVLPLIFRSFTRRPLLAEAGLGSALFEPELGARALGPFATVPAIEFLTTLGERAKVPNALLRKALSAYGKTEGAGIPTSWEPQLALPPAPETPSPAEWGTSAITGKPRGTMPGPTVGPIYAPYRGEPAGSEPTKPPTPAHAVYPTAPQPIPEGQSTVPPTPVSFAGAKAPLTPGDIVTLASRVASRVAGEGAPEAPAAAREPIFDIGRIRQEEAALRGPKAGTTIALSPQARELLRQILEGKK